MSKHTMMYEGRGSRTGKRKVVKKTKKSSPLSRTLHAWWRKGKDVLGIVGGMVVIWWLIQLVMAGR